MRPVRITISGFRSFRAAQTIEFCNLGLFAIIGDTGAGKSSILEAMVYALYNKSTYDERGVKSLIALDADTMRVDLQFAVGDANYVVTRSASRITGRPAIHSLRSLADSEARFHNDTTVSNEIVRITKLGYTAFIKTVVLPQGRFAELLTASGSDREAVLTALFSLDEVDRLRDSLLTPSTRAREICIGLRSEFATYGEDPAFALATLLSRLTESESVWERLAEVSASCRQRTDEQQSDVDRKQRFADANRRIRDLDVGAQRIDALEELHVELREAIAVKAAERKVAHEEQIDAAAQLSHLRGAGVDVESLQRSRDALRTIGEQEAQCASDERLLAGERTIVNERKAKLDTTLRQILADQKKHSVLEEVARVAETECASASRIRDEASAAWVALVLARRRLNEALALREEVDLELLGARGGCERATAAVLSGDENAEAARIDFEHAQIAGLAATVGASVSAGADCPVCSQRIPAAYEPPRSADLESARKAEKAARKAQTEKHAALAGLRERLAQLELKREVALRTIAARSEAEGSVRSVAVALEVDIFGDGEDTALLPFTRKWEAAKSAYAVAAQRVVASSSEISAASATCTTLQSVVEEGYERLEERAKVIADSRGRIEQTRLSVHDEFRPLETSSASALQDAISRVDEDMVVARAAQARANTAEAAVHIADRAAREAELRVASDVTAVIDANTAVCDEAARVLRDFELGTAMQAAPLRLKGDAESAILWASSVCAWCVTAVEALRLETIAADARILQKQHELDALLQSVVSPNVLELDRMLHEARANVAVLRDRVISARENAERAERSSARLASIEPLRVGLEALAHHLDSNRFKKYLTGLREQSLLGAATDILRKVSDGRFAFAAGFQILDGQTQLTRDAKTLSGGEKFLASLALALGLVEMTSRGGAHLDAIFLDEGFGSLDAAALDAALLELKERADSGKLIGVITHVRGIASEIEDVIRVQRFPSGSVATKLTATERDDMMGEAVVSGLLEAAS